MTRILRSFALIAASLVLGASLQGCVLAAGAAAGAAGGYEAKKHGYDVRSPVKKDSAGGYKGQAPVVKHPEDDDSASSTTQNNGNYDTSGRSYNARNGGYNDTGDYRNGAGTTTTNKR